MSIPHFTPEQLIEIYEASGRANTTEALQAVASTVYPNITGGDSRPPVFVVDGCHKWFLVDGEYTAAKYSIFSRLMNGIGIMPDGTPISYDK